MGILNKFIFDGVDSSDYDVLVSGEGVFNSPERDVEVIEVPGRNGAFILDKGRFKNIEVTYPIKNHEANLADFRSKLAGLRNALSSKVGYKRLEDTFHPDEYRMAQFSGPMEVDPIKYNYATDAIDITFNCKPQRYLKSGETEQTVTSGGTITNPTLFESAPLLTIEGDGHLDINGYGIDIQGNEPIGEVNLSGGANIANENELTITINTDLLETGDDIYVADVNVSFELCAKENEGKTIASYTNRGETGYSSATVSDSLTNGRIYGVISYGRESFKLGTSRDIGKDIVYAFTDSAGASGQDNVTIRYQYDGDKTFTFKITVVQSFTYRGSTPTANGRVGTITGYSNITQGGTTIIDCEIGEAYKYDDGQLIPLNSLVSLEADLPTLQPGTNTVTYDNTITSLKIVPRWWKI